MTVHWLFCHSNFLVRHQKADPALDFQARVMLDQNGNQVSIMDVQTYRDHLNKDSSAMPWWAGDLTPLNGYYFTDSGGDFCAGTNLGLTATLETLTRAADGKAERGQRIWSVVLCPYAFDQSPQPNSYKDANNLLAEGTNLAAAVPKSATLLHELFHLLNGGHFLTGADEKCKSLAVHFLCCRKLKMILTAVPADDLAECIKLSNSPEAAQANPENYVFFIAHMYHLYGEKDGEEPWSIGKNWNFASQGRGRNRVFGATQRGM